MVDLDGGRFDSGYWNGLRQPTFIFDVRFTKNSIQRSALEKFDQVVETLLPPSGPWNHPKIVAEHLLLSRLSNSSMEILALAGMPIMSGVNASEARRQDGIHWLLGLPAVSADILAPQWAISWSARLLRFLDDGREISIESLRQDLKKFISTFKRQAPAGVNTLRFLQAASEQDIPWRHVANNVYQFGWGSRARWLDSSFTDETPRISVSLARNKRACAEVLRQAGLPVPSHRLVRDESHAVEVADALGYPVVVKPADLDGGRGVFACLRDEQAVRKAYAAARGLSQCILVEQYVPGQDYRLQVYRGNVFWTVLRRPAYVTGDGTTTVEALIHRTNLERKEPPPDPMIEQGVKPIMIDDELHDWLHYQGLTLTSVPAVGRQVRLHGAANVSAGGTREAILHKVHPDNLALAIHAARVLRLDLAGIDLLIPDIARSWKEGGAAICEVNSQPQLSAHLHRSLLPRMVPKQGRIPVIVLLGCFPDLGSLRHQVVAATRASGLRLGWVGMDAVAIGDEAWPLAFDGGAGGPGADTIDHAVAVARALLADPQIDALIWQVKTWPDTERGLPFDKVDGLIWLDDKASVAAPAPRANFSPRCWMIGASDGSDVQRLAAADLPRHLAALIGVPTHRLNEEEDDRI